MLAIAGATACGACSASAGGGGPSGSDGEALVVGDATAERPEVGQILSDVECTATLIGPDVVLTAAHCFGYETADTSARRWLYFTGTAVANVLPGVGIDKVASFGTEVGRYDFAIAHLAHPVPASEATPARLGSESPARHETITVFGYGCTDRASLTGGEVKRKFTYANDGPSQVLCPGDSGGPRFRENGDLFAVNSGYDAVGDDLYGDAAGASAKIAEIVAEWSAPPAPPAPPPPPKNDAPMPCPTDGAKVCTPWVLTAWDSEDCSSGYTRGRTCDPRYDCRTTDHNGPCTALNPGGDPQVRCGSCP